MYSSVTHSIAVNVEPSYLASESDPKIDRYFWKYHIIIQNNGALEVQLLSRYWHITDAHGQVQEVRGDGVVGETPVLAPGAKYEYTSGCPLSTPSGIMSGSFQMAREDGTLLEIEIPAFSLDIPGQSKALN
jgi:ApaG protein